MVEIEMEMALASIKTLQTDLEADKHLELFRIEQAVSPVCVSEIDRFLEETLSGGLQDVDEKEACVLEKEFDELMGKYNIVAGSARPGAISAISVSAWPPVICHSSFTQPSPSFSIR